MSTNSLGDCPHPFFSLAYSANETSDGKSYINAFENLRSGYDMKSMAQAIISFKKGSTANNSGIYTSYDLIFQTNKKSLLKYYSIKIRY